MTVSVEAPFPYPETKPLTAIKNLIVVNDPEDEQKRGLPDGCGAILCGNLQSDIGERGYFRILEREALDRVLEEQELVNGDLFDNNSLAGKMGCLAGADGLILVTLQQYKYSEEKISHYRPLYDQAIGAFKWFVNLVTEIKHTPTLIHERRGSARVEGRIRLIDASTAEIVRESVIPSEHGELKKKANGEPETIDHEALLRRCRMEISGTFASRLYPVMKKENVVMHKGGGWFGIGSHQLMDKGVAFAEDREWEKALKEFAKARESLRQNGPAEKPEEEWCSLMNMAVMHACLSEFDDAFKTLDEAEILIPTADFSDEYSWIQHRREIHEEFQAQFEINKIPPLPVEETEGGLIKNLVDGVSGLWDKVFG